MIIWGESHEDEGDVPGLLVLILLCLTALCVVLAQLHVFSQIVVTVSGQMK